MMANLLTAPIWPVSERFDAYTAPAVRDWLDQQLTAGHVRLVIDLTAARFVDSTALAVLVSGMKRCREHGGDLVLCGLGTPVRIIFELTRLDRAFAIYPDATAAREALSGGGVER